jgi:hypothetical protein
MMSYKAIRYNDWKNAYRAHADELEPLQFDALQDIKDVGKHVHQMGGYVPEGWTLTHRIFVDKGFGGHARSINEVISILKRVYKLAPQVGVALSNEGQFQIHLDVYFRSDADSQKAQELLENEREVYAVSDTFSAQDFSDDKIFRWECSDCQADCITEAGDTCPTCDECGASFDKGDL